MSSFQALKTSKYARQKSRIAPSTCIRNENHRTDSIQHNDEAGPSTRKSPPVALVDNRKQDHEEPGEVDTDYELPEGIVCKRTEKRGRGLYASKRFAAGSRIMTSTPTVSVLSTPHLASYCSSCKLSPSEINILLSRGDVPKPLRRCVGCKMAYYCSPECQRSDWDHHREECSAHKRLRSIYSTQYIKEGEVLDESQRWIMSESVRALGRLCWARKKARDKNTGRDPAWWDQIERMESHLKRLDENHVLELANTVQHLQQYLSALNPGVEEEEVPVNMEDYGFRSSAELLNLVSAFKVNSFTLSSPSLSPIGVVMSPLVALFNHSCDPNAVVVFPKGGGRGMEVIAIRTIEPNEEILTSYIDVSLPGKARRQDLKKRYGFECDCPLCTIDSKDKKVDPRWCVRHPGCTSAKAGNANMPDLERWVGTYRAECNACGDGFEVNVELLEGLIDRGKEVLRQDEHGKLDTARTLNTLSSLLPQLLNFLPPSSYPLLPLLRLHSLLLTPPQSPFDQIQSISSLAKAYAGAEVVHPPNHPTLAIILAEWGKLLAMELGEKASKEEMGKRLLEAIVVLRKAFGVAEKGFGPGGGLVGIEVGGLIRGCEGELGLLRSAQG